MNPLGLITLPHAILHEVTHAVALWPWTEDWAWDIDTTTAKWYVDLDDDIPRWAWVFGHLAPTIVGFGLAAAITIWWALSGGDLPADVVGWAKLSIALISWLVYVSPLGDDLKGARAS